PDGPHHRESPGGVEALAAADPLAADDEVVEVARLHLGRALVPVVLEVDRVDPVLLEAPDPAEAGQARLVTVVDPELEHPVRATGIVEPGARLDAVPLPDVPPIEDRGVAPGPGAESQVGEVVVLGRQQPTREADAGGG